MRFLEEILYFIENITNFVPELNLFAFLLLQKHFISLEAAIECSENMQQIYRRIPKPKCDFNKVTLQLY